MKFDLFTKAILSVIAVLLALNLFANTQIFPAKQVYAAPATFLQNGKSYTFFSGDANTQFAFGKIVSVEENGWVKVAGYYHQGTIKDEFMVNTDNLSMITQIQERK